MKDEELKVEEIEASLTLGGYRRCDATLLWFSEKKVKKKKIFFKQNLLNKTVKVHILFNDTGCVPLCNNL